MKQLIVCLVMSLCIMTISLVVCHEQNEAIQQLRSECSMLMEQLDDAKAPTVDNSRYAAMPYRSIPLAEGLQDYTYAMCDYYDISEYYDLVLAVMSVESEYNASAISETGDYGLMQINECNHEWLAQNLGLVDMLDPAQNIHAGVYILSGYLHKYDVEKSLMCYNLGTRGAVELWNQGIYTTSYTSKVMTEVTNYEQN